MTDIIDDKIVEAAAKSFTLKAWGIDECEAAKADHSMRDTFVNEYIRAALLAALPMIGERLASEAESEADKVETLRHRLRFYDEGLAVVDTAVNHLRAFAARIRELTGAKP
jgi:hydrogenase maturation factor HypF (carbamoyltransferase family)